MFGIFKSKAANASSAVSKTLATVAQALPREHLPGFCQVCEFMGRGEGKTEIGWTQRGNVVKLRLYCTACDYDVETTLDHSPAPPELGIELCRLAGRWNADMRTVTDYATHHTEAN